MSFAWDSNPELDVIGYRIHWGVKSGRYVNTIDVGNVTRYTIEQAPDPTFYTVVTAYNSAGLESFPSNEVCVWVRQTSWARRFNNNTDLDGDGELDGEQICIYAEPNPADFPDLDFEDPAIVLIWEVSQDLENWEEAARGPASRPLTTVRPMVAREFFRWRLIDTSDLH